MINNKMPKFFTHIHSILNWIIWIIDAEHINNLLSMSDATAQVSILYLPGVQA